MIPTVLILSFLLEGMFSNLVTNTQFLVPFFTLVSLLVLYPYYNNSNKNFIISSVLMGLFYDIVYTDSIFINTFTFLIISLFIIKINEYVNYNLLNISWISILTIIIYRILSYLLLCMVGYINFNGNVLIRGIYSSFIINVLYSIFLFYIVDLIGKKLKLKRVE